MSNKSQGVVSGYLQQQMLIAMPAMADPNFSRSVTLMCQHNKEGAIGITINRQSDFTLGELLFQLNISCENQEISSMIVLEGGPVSPERGFVLHTPFEGFDSSIKINDDIMVTTSRDVLAAIAVGNGPAAFPGSTWLCWLGRWSTGVGDAPECVAISTGGQGHPV